MKLKKKVISIIMLLVVIIVFMAPINIMAATIGQVLTSPDSGWTRYDNTDKRFTYIGTWTSYAAGYNGSFTYANSSTASLSFKFSGTKLRIIANARNVNRPTDVTLKIDGTSKTFSETYGGDEVNQVLCFEISNLENSVHTVSISSSQSSGSCSLTFDAIDIDSTGSLVDKDQPINIVATSLESQITLTWDTIANATSYKIKRAETSGGPYNTVFTSNTNNYTDTGLINGVTYYYVISSITSSGESNNSAEVSAIYSAPVNLSNATLNIVMINGDIKEYNLSSIEINDFLTWYDNKAKGTGMSYYIFTVKGDINPYTEIKNYIPFDKI
jgi:hypothetical protein